MAIEPLYVGTPISVMIDVNKGQVEEDNMEGTWRNMDGVLSERRYCDSIPAAVCIPAASSTIGPPAKIQSRYNRSDFD